MSGHRPFSDLLSDLTAKQYLERSLEGWRFILQANRDLGWPDQAMCVDQPTRFISQLEQILQRMNSEEQVT
jgi:hypothetical protein